jgi:hypothetical protein
MLFRAHYHPGARGAGDPPDGCADLDSSGQPGLGAHAHAEFGIPVIGVAKSRFRPPTASPTDPSRRAICDVSA